MCSNIHFWEYMQPGYDALGFISCTGTNFLVRARAFQEAGWSPEYTLTEDFALGMELKKRGWQCRWAGRVGGGGGKEGARWSAARAGTGGRGRHRATHRAPQPSAPLIL